MMKPIFEDCVPVLAVAGTLALPLAAHADGQLDLEPAMWMIGHRSRSTDAMCSTSTLSAANRWTASTRRSFGRLPIGSSGLCQRWTSAGAAWFAWCSSRGRSTILRQSMRIHDPQPGAGHYRFTAELVTESAGPNRKRPPPCFKQSGGFLLVLPQAGKLKYIICKRMLFTCK